MSTTPVLDALASNPAHCALATFLGWAKSSGHTKDVSLVQGYVAALIDAEAISYPTWQAAFDEMKTLGASA